MSKDLLIIGAAQDGMVAADVVQAIGNEWNLLGFLDDDPAKQRVEMNGFPVLGAISEAARYPDCYFAIMLGSPQRYATKRRVFAKLGMGLERYATLIHPDASISGHTNIGKGTIVTAGVIILPNCRIGNHVYLLPNSYVANETDVGDYVTIGAGAVVAGEQVVKEGAYVAASATIRDHVTVGEWALVGMGSVVVSDVPAYHVVVGNPAKVLRSMKASEFDT